MSRKVNLVSDYEKLRIVKLYLNGGISLLRFLSSRVI